MKHFAIILKFFPHTQLPVQQKKKRAEATDSRYYLTSDFDNDVELNFQMGSPAKLHQLSHTFTQIHTHELFLGSYTTRPKRHFVAIYQRHHHKANKHKLYISSQFGRK